MRAFQLDERAIHINSKPDLHRQLAECLKLFEDVRAGLRKVRGQNP